MSAESAGADSVGGFGRAKSSAESPGALAGRLFVALDLDDDSRAALASWQASVVSSDPGVRRVPADALHVTLCFLGTCEIEDVDAIAAACAIGSGAPLPGLALGEAMWLPARRPRVLAVGIEDGTGALAHLQSALAQALHAGGWYPPEARPFLAHVTVARVGRGERGERPLAVTPPPPPPLALAETATVTLYRSHLSPKGSRYEALRSIPVDLAPPAAPHPTAPARADDRTSRA